MTTPRRVTCVLVNETTEQIIATGKTLNCKIEQGDLVGTMPVPIAASAKAPFTLTQSAGSTVGPSGWACYELEHQSLVYQIGFGDPAQGADSFTIGLNYLDKLGEGVTSVKFANAAGSVDPANVAAEMDLTVEYHLGFKPAVQPAPSANPNAPVSQPVAGSAGSAATVVVPPYFARWNQKGITQKRKKVLAAIYKTYPMLWAERSEAAKSVAPENGGTSSGPWSTYRHQGLWGGGGTTCTTSCPIIGRAVSPLSANRWSFSAYGAKAGWTPWGSPDKKMPSVGDIYLLVRDEIVRPLPAAPTVARPDPDATAEQKADPDYKSRAAVWKKYDSQVALMNPHERHVGIVVQVPTTPAEIFISADGGQKAHSVEAAHLVKRAWSKRAPGPSDSQYMDIWKNAKTAKDMAFAKPKDGIECAYLVGGAEAKSPADGNRLVGWIDVDQLEFGSDDFDENFTEADYNALGAILDGMK